MGFLRHKSGSSIEVPRGLEEVFSALVASGAEVGKVKEQSKLAGYVVIRTPMKLFPPLNPATVRISLKKQVDNATLVTFESDSLDGAVGFGSAGKAIDQIIKGLEKRL